MDSDSRRNSSIKEVGFVNHFHEFCRFYDRHTELCDELSGMKERIMKEKGSEKRYIISASNFHFGITKLNSFLIDNLHYVDDYDKRKDLMSQLKKIEIRYINDEEYLKLINTSNRDVNKEVELQQRYFEYLQSCFKIGSEIMILLQTSLMISTKDIHKNIVYHDDSKFFLNLGRYRDSLSDNLANFKFSNVLDHIKKIEGYFYSYNLFIDLEIRRDLEKLIDYIIELILTKENLSLVISIRKNLNLSNKQKLDVRELSSYIRDALSFIYVKTNECLQEKNLFPKRQKRIFIDKTTI